MLSSSASVILRAQVFSCLVVVFLVCFSALGWFSKVPPLLLGTKAVWLILLLETRGKEGCEHLEQSPVSLSACTQNMQIKWLFGAIWRILTLFRLHLNICWTTWAASNHRNQGCGFGNPAALALQGLCCCFCSSSASDVLGTDLGMCIKKKNNQKGRCEVEKHIPVKSLLRLHGKFEFLCEQRNWMWGKPRDS